MAAVAVLGVFPSFDVESQDGCEVTCPCDSPVQEKVTLTVTPCDDSAEELCSNRDCNQAFDDLGLNRSTVTPPPGDYDESESTSVPCPSDCQDCACNASQMMAGLADQFPPVPVKSAGILFRDWAPILALGAFENIFHPPRTRLA